MLLHRFNNSEDDTYYDPNHILRPPIKNPMHSLLRSSSVLVLVLSKITQAT